MQQHRFLLLFLVFALLSNPLSAQKKRRAAAPKTPAVPVLEQARQAMDVYDFDGASNILSKAIAEQEKKRKPTEDIEALEALRPTLSEAAQKQLDALTAPAEPTQTNGQNEP